MGRAERRAGLEAPPCPKCGPTNAAQLASEGEYARFQCGKCLDTYCVPRSSSRQAAIEAAEEGAVHQAEETVSSAERDGGFQDKSEESLMAKYKCEKCGKVYQRGGDRFKKHVDGCQGAEGRKPAKGRAAAAVPRKGARPRGGSFAAAILEIEKKREEVLARLLEDPELVRIDRALEALRELSGVRR